MGIHDDPEKDNNIQPGIPSITGSGPETGLQKQIALQAAQLRAKSELIDNMIYQIRTLSNAIIGFSDLLSTEPLSNDQSEYIQEIHHAGHGLSVLVNDVLDWAQLLSGKLQVSKIKFYVADIIKDIENVLFWAVKEKGLDYQVITDPEIPACIYSDQERLLKCLLNLTVGAIRYAPQGDIRFHVHSETKSDQAYLCFDVIDNGVGITPDELETIFEPTDYRIEVDAESFSQLSRGLTVTAGLPLTKLLCEELGGTLEVVSRNHEELTFSLCIPAGVDPAREPKLGTISWERAVETQPSQESPQEEPSSPNTILLVEDQPSNRAVISLMLEALGVRVDTAENGEEAIIKAESGEYDLILMDIKMPRMNGYEATRQLRQNGLQTPIVALSAKVFDDAEHRQISTMFDGFLTKPVDSRKLSETLTMFFDRFSEQDEQGSECAGVGGSHSIEMGIE
jgi:CheY-like chemotaxis protein